jgi:hypothetical protein
MLFVALSATTFVDFLARVAFLARFAAGIECIFLRKGF